MYATSAPFCIFRVCVVPLHNQALFVSAWKASLIFESCTRFVMMLAQFCVLVGFEIKKNACFFQDLCSHSCRASSCWWGSIISQLRSATWGGCQWYLIFPNFFFMFCELQITFYPILYISNTAWGVCIFGLWCITLNHHVRC